MVSGFASLINGGTYYQPHLVTKITDSTGNTISTVEPKAVKQTISQSTSDKIRDYLQSVVKEGTGNTAKWMDILWAVKQEPHRSFRVETENILFHLWDLPHTTIRRY